MRVYLDMCSLQRPLDTKTHARIAVEAEAILNILVLCEVGTVELISSDALVYELERNPHLIRRTYAQDVLSNAPVKIRIDEQVTTRARAIHATGIQILDAFHLAFAICANADYFCTCDDRLLKRALNIDTGSTKVISPLALVEEVLE